MTDAFHAANGRTRCRARHAFEYITTIEFQCLEADGHDGAHHAWIGMALSHDLYWTDDGGEFDYAHGYRTKTVLH